MLKHLPTFSKISTDSPFFIEKNLKTAGFYNKIVNWNSNRILTQQNSTRKSMPKLSSSSKKSNDIRKCQSKRIFNHYTNHKCSVKLNRKNFLDSNNEIILLIVNLHLI